ncbi:S-adenosyl-L-methionine-dependent methyltransferase [Hyaloscypha bicolor E]|jgi:predicted O-methyltransferase YrrM|uniref:S-adenosyl-L-methionine-dependent methyltransferase n=1 Tax=Hyaloscypha bicolor E TaxID=1095630 RepID=A0A2J6TFM3_9HELO|nr:S-adenosyl-L-methionine-dependent methyltransferase [Hyaloscypha bicolor E]PMD61827.1 S-adenosyl-L-methionine-dependent methyltransferase [Hyaloscypha bicolor E]
MATYTLEKATALDAYVCDHLLPTDPALEAALKNNASSNLDAIDVAANQGKQLYLLAKMIKAKRVLEVGTLGGYSAIWFSKAVGPEGKVITLEVEPEHAKVARENISNAGLKKVVEVKVNPALATLAQMQKEGTEAFDMVFIDADKDNNPGYFTAALAMSHVGTLIVVDNIARRGRLIDPNSTAGDVLGTRKLFEMMGKEKRVEATAVQTVGSKGWDGYAMALVVE